MLDLEAVRTIVDAARPAHGAIPPGEPLWQAWSVDPPFLIPIALLAWWYAQGLLRWRTRTRDHGVWRTLSFYSGVLILVLAMESPLDRMGVHEFSMHMVQHELLMMVAVPLMLLGAPTTPVLLGLPAWLRRGVVRPLAGRTPMRWLYRTLTRPMVAVGLFSAVFFGWHFGPGWYEAALRDQKIHDIEHFTMTFAAILFWWNVIDPKPLHSRMNPVLQLMYQFAAGLPKQFIAAAITFAPAPLYRYYADVRPVFSTSALDDQVLAGLIMWIPGGTMMLGAMALTFYVWAHRAEIEGKAEAEAFAAAHAARASHQIPPEH